MNRPLCVALLILAGCGPQLPRGWEDADPVSDFEQRACSGSPYEPFEVALSAETTDSNALRVRYSKAHYRCEQDLTAFWRKSATGVEILVQPQDMDPAMVAGCDCLYDLTMELAAPAPSGNVTIFRRLDNLNEPNDPERVGEATW